MPEPFGQAQALDRVFTEHQCMFQIKTLGIGTIQPLVQAGPCQVIGSAGIAQFQHAFGIHQGFQRCVIGQMQLPQVA